MSHLAALRVTVSRMSQCVVCCACSDAYAFTIETPAMNVIKEDDEYSGLRYFSLLLDDHGSTAAREPTMWFAGRRGDNQLVHSSVRFAVHLCKAPFRAVSNSKRPTSA